MKVKDLTLDQWQEKIAAFKSANPNAKSGCAFRVDGTQFSVGAYYGGFTYNGEMYTCFYFPTEGNAIIGVRADFLRWVTKELKKKAKNG